MIQPDTFLQRRRALLAKMPVASAAILFSAPETLRSHDTEYPYRQNSNFWYFTGFNEPQAALVLIKHRDGHHESVLFNRRKEPRAEIWHGRRLGQQAALKALAVDRAFAWDDIGSQLYLLLNQLDAVCHAQGVPAQDSVVFGALEKLRTGARESLFAPAMLIDWRPWVHEMRLYKSAPEIALLRQAGKISALAHTRAMQACRPGMYEYQLEGEILHEFNRHGARFPAYNTIVGSGENACILHYTENNRRMCDGDLVLIDAGCELYGYAGDITRTFPVNGKFSAPQRAVYEVVLASLNKALSLFRPGTTIQKVNAEVTRVMVCGLVRLGVLNGDVEQLIAEEAHRAFFMHGLSHWLGLDVHDVGDYGAPVGNRLLQPGMVLTVEPGIYIAPDADVAPQWRGIGIRIEDDIVITNDGNENLTDSVVKDPDAIEAIMAAVRT